MGLADLTKTSVDQTLDEFDKLGRRAFLEKYGFGPSRKYFLLRDGVGYDSKAVCGAAHQWVDPEKKPMRAADFSGGDKTVAVRLSKLGFSVVDAPVRLPIGGATGTPLRATCEVHRLGAGFAVTIQSAGGGAIPRNPDYTIALEAILSRLGQASARLDDVLLDTDETRHLPESERSLIDVRPLAMSVATDAETLGASMRKASAAISVDPSKKSGGNGNKQIQLRFSADGLTTAEEVRSWIVSGGVRLFVVTWNPKVWPISDEDYRETVALTENGGRSAGSWSTGNRKSGIVPGWS